MTQPDLNSTTRAGDRASPATDATVAALRRERAALVVRGATARVEAVDAELAALGVVDAPPVAAPVEQPKRAPRQTRA